MQSSFVSNQQTISTETSKSTFLLRNFNFRVKNFPKSKLKITNLKLYYDKSHNYAKLKENEFKEYLKLLLHFLRNHLSFQIKNREHVLSPKN